MVTLPWTELNPSLAIRETRKKYFNKYLYKAVVYVPCGTLILSKLESLAEAEIEYRRSRLPITAQWNAYAKKKEVEAASADQITYYKHVRAKYPDVKFRVEEPHISIFSDNEQTLFDIANNDPTQRLLSIYRPANEAALEILDLGQIIMKKPNGYQYRVFFREGKSSDKPLTQVYDYLMSLDDQVLLSPGLKRNLSNPYYWFSGGYFYVNDPSVLTFLNLIAPGLVSGFSKVVHVDS